MPFTPNPNTIEHSRPNWANLHINFLSLQILNELNIQNLFTRGNFNKTFSKWIISEKTAMIDSCGIFFGEAVNAEPWEPGTARVANSGLTDAWVLITPKFFSIQKRTFYKT